MTTAKKTIAQKFEPPRIIPLEEKDQLLMENVALKTELAKARVHESQRILMEQGQHQLDTIYATIIREVPVVLDVQDPKGLAERYRYSDQAKALILVDQIIPKG